MTRSSEMTLDILYGWIVEATQLGDVKRAQSLSFMYGLLAAQ